MCLRAWAKPSLESLPLGAFMFVQEARHSENLYLIHNMNSICKTYQQERNRFRNQ